MNKAQKAYRKLSTFETAEDIRRFFQKKGVRGIPSRASSCPVSVYLNGEDGDPNNVFGCSSYFIIYGERCNTTEAIRDFVLTFDRYQYPKLIKEGYYR